MSARGLARFLILFPLCAALLAACAPAMAPTPAAEEQATQNPAAEEPAAEEPAAEPEVETRPPPVEQPTAAPVIEPTQAPLVEDRLVELEWPSRLRMGESDVIRLALVPSKDGYVAKAEFPEHDLQTQSVPVPRPNGYALYAVARLDGVGFEIAPGGDQERFVPPGEEVAWRWTLSPRAPGQQRLSIQLRLRWVPAAGMPGSARESLAYGRGIDVRVASFLGMSRAQAAFTGVIGTLLGCGCLLLAAAGPLLGGARVAPGQIQAVRAPERRLDIDCPPGLALSAEESGLLQALFAAYRRLVIENEFLSGYSGARTFLIRPVRPDGGADALTIVKLGPQAAIRQEFASYEAFVKDRLPPMTARIQRPPVALAGSREAAAVQYTFISEPGRPPVSLRRALLADPDPALIERLFETFGPNWWMQRRAMTFRLGQEYDGLLPPHYVLEPLESKARRASRVIAENDDPARLALSVGDVVEVRPFRQVEMRADRQSCSLLGVSSAGRPALRLRWLSPRPPQRTGLARVSAARMDLLRGWTKTLDRFGLPDPLEALPALLEETVPGSVSVIHGDLNLENVLVGPGSLVWLIDFAQTREGHPLYDFAHLESELIAHVLTPRAGSSQAYLDLWQRGDEPLLQALHAIAGRCLLDPARPREYHLALTLACLGALKYANLLPPARYNLYLTAAHLVETALRR